MAEQVNVAELTAHIRQLEEVLVLLERLKKLQQEVRRAHITTQAFNKIFQIAKLVAPRLGVAPALVMSPDRTGKVAIARALVVLLATEIYGLTAYAIGPALKRKPATIYHAVRVARDLIDIDPKLRQIYQQAKEDLENEGSKPAACPAPV
ncbi:MAG: hypothetical protein N2379_10500 [Verrucomicrobiae bacterium]|nr:hypothetical protein [Verrucomicrobiae bacterium]